MGYSRSVRLYRCQILFVKFEHAQVLSICWITTNHAGNLFLIDWQAQMNPKEVESILTVFMYWHCSSGDMMYSGIHWLLQLREKVIFIRWMPLRWILVGKWWNRYSEKLLLLSIWTHPPMNMFHHTKTHGAFGRHTWWIFFLAITSTPLVIGEHHFQLIWSTSLSLVGSFL